MELSRALAAAGDEVRILYVRGDGTPARDELQAAVGARVELAEMVAVRRGPGLILALRRAVTEETRAWQPTIVHLHSTWAGIAGRLPSSAAQRLRTVYSPHGFSFLRKDLRWPVRAFFWLVEALLARRCAGLVLVSEAEAAVAQSLLARDRLAVLLNRVVVGPAPVRTESEKPKVVTVGRISAQKAPWRFGNLARLMGDLAEFEWIGDGEPRERERWLGGSPVRVSGWVAREEVIRRLKGADVFVLASQWEGLPMALLESQAYGVPSVVSDIPPNAEVVSHGSTGFVCAGFDQLQASVRQLVTDSQLRDQMGSRARKRIAERYSPDSLAEDAHLAYDRLVTENGEAL
ncbi:glycosyltransferase [Blastococcus sp. SYSU DS0552]